MPSYVELNDEDGARSAANELREIGDRLQEFRPAPAVVWGDDKYGVGMRAKYFDVPEGEESSLPVAATAARMKLGEKLTEAGDDLLAAIDEITGAERTNVGSLDGVQPPYV